MGITHGSAEVSPMDQQRYHPWISRGITHGYAWEHPWRCTMDTCGITYGETPPVQSNQNIKKNGVTI